MARYIMKPFTGEFVEKDGLENQEKREQYRVVNFVRRLRKNRLAFLGTIILAAVIFMVTVAPLVIEGEPTLIRSEIRNLPPTSKHWFGTDDLGRDLFLRVIYGARISLGISLAVSFIALVMGTIIGLISGYRGGLVDNILSRIIDSLMAFPSILLALVVMAVLGSGFENVIIALSIVYMPRLARVARGPVLAQKGLEYVESARSIGASHTRIMFRHILPNVLSPIIVQATIIFAYAMVAEATLGFLGVGIPPPEPTWGNLLADGRRMLRIAPWQTVFPAAVLGITVLGINLLGDGLRDILDPRMRGSK